MMGIRTTPPRTIPGRLIIECPCGDGINIPNTVEGAQLVDEFTNKHECGTP